MQQSKDTAKPYKEGQLLLAKSAIDRGQIRSNRRSAAIYGIPASTLLDRRNGKPSRRDCEPNSKKLTKLEEEVIIQHILDLDTRGFAPSYRAISDMANHLLSARGGAPVGIKWPTNFVKRTPTIKARLNRKYDYQRAKCEDPIIIGAWFELVRNTLQKYGIAEEDIYNFDEAGCQMGVISTAVVITGAERRSRPKTVQPGNREWVTIIQGVNCQGWAIPPFIIFAGKNHLSAWYEEEGIPYDWVISLSENGWTTNKIGLDLLKHFDMHTKDRTTGVYRLLIFDGHESHNSLQFKLYCEENKIITLCMPPHSSHLLQPLDVGCFAPLKKAYGHQIQSLMRNYIHHITKLEFIPAIQSCIQDSNYKR